MQSRGQGGGAARSAQVRGDDPSPQFVTLAVHVQAVLQEQLRARPAVGVEHRGGDIDEVDVVHPRRRGLHQRVRTLLRRQLVRSEEHTSELQSLMRISYAVFCLKKKTSLHKQKANTNS